MTQDQLDLLHGYLNGTLDEANFARFQSLLRDSAEARHTLRSLSTVEAKLTQLAAIHPETVRLLSETARQSGPSFCWFAWRPLTAAAAGIVFGMLCTSVVFGFGARSVEKVISLLQESFESGPAPLVTGIPQDVNLWSGDYLEVVEKYEGLKPAHGTKMIRMLRSDFEGKASSMPNRQGDLSRVIDVRPFLREANGGEVVMTLSALFNAAPFPEAERYDGVVTLYALGEPGSTEENLMEDALAISNGSRNSMDRDPSTWESATSRLLLPTGTEFVMLKVSFRRWPKGSESQSSLPDLVTFAGHFVDDVRASVNIRKVVANQRNEALP